MSSTTLIQRLEALGAERLAYALETLAIHLDVAGQHGRLISLFDDSQWMQARVKHAGSVYTGFLADLNLAFQKTVERGGRGEDTIAPAFKMALISSTIASRSMLDPSLIAEAARRAIWPVSRAIAAAETLGSHLDRLAVYWALLAAEVLQADDRQKVEALAASCMPTPLLEVRARWMQLGQTLQEIRGDWAERDVTSRAVDLLCAVHPFLTIGLRLDGRFLEGEIDLGRDRTDPVVDQLAQTSPARARAMMVSAARYSRAAAPRGFGAIRLVPGYDDDERAQAERLLSFALEPRAHTVGMPQRSSAHAVLWLLDAETVERLAPSIKYDFQRVPLVVAVFDARERANPCKGNPNRARALAALARGLPEDQRVRILERAVEELDLLFKNVQAAPKKRGRKRKQDKAGAARMAGRLIPMPVRGGKNAAGLVEVVFEDHAEIDEGIAELRTHDTDELADLEISYAPFAAAVEALAEVMPARMVTQAADLALQPLPDFGWCCIRTLCALAHRFEGELLEVRQTIFERMLDTLERLPSELRPEHWQRLARVLDSTELLHSLDRFRASADTPEQARVAAALVPLLAEDAKPALTQVLLDAVAAIEDEEEKLRALRALVALATRETAPRILELAEGLAEVAGRMQIVSALAPLLSLALRQSSIAAAFEEGNHHVPENDAGTRRLIEGWAALLPHMEGPQRKWALENAVALARDLTFESDFKVSVSRLGPFLDKPAVATLEAYRWEMDEVLLLFIRCHAAHLLSALERTELVRAVQALPEDAGRVELLAILGQAASATPSASAPATAPSPEAILQRLGALRTSPRGELLSYCARPEFAASVSRATAAKIAHSLEEVCSRWAWP